MKKAVISISAVLLALAIICGIIDANKGKETKPKTKQVASATDIVTEETAKTETEEKTEETAKKSKIGIAKDIPSNATPSKYADSTYIPPTESGPNYSGHNFPESVDNIDDNIFMDALKYCGYNVDKHRAAGRMWQYVLSAQKKTTGWLSNITYNGGSSGYETTSQGAPDIQYFEKHGLVCASYAAYVYFNYLPNVAGVDTTMLTKPEKPYVANDWYLALLDWEKKGYTKQIKVETSGSAGTFLKLTSHEEIPIGSLVCMNAAPNSSWCSHICVYAGYKNGYHWVYHVGNENGPEFCSIERMTFGPDPQYMLAIFSTPTCVESIR